MTATDVCRVARRDQPSVPSEQGSRYRPARDLDLVVKAAAEGDAVAWSRLVGRFGWRVRGVARGYGLTPADQDEVEQRTWVRLITHIGQLRIPAAIGAWLATAAHRESLALLRRARREVPLDTIEPRDGIDWREPVEVAERRERDAALLCALERISPRQRVIVRTLLDQPAASYEEIGRALGVPTGSIGPTRARALARLRRDRRLAAAVSAQAMT